MALTPSDSPWPQVGTPCAADCSPYISLLGASQVIRCTANLCVVVSDDILAMRAVQMLCVARSVWQFLASVYRVASCTFLQGRRLGRT